MARSRRTRATTARPRKSSPKRSGVCLTAQEGQQPPPQGGQAAGQGTSDGAAPAARLPPQDGADAAAGTTTPSISKICGSPIWYGTDTSPRASAMPAGQQFRSILEAKAACAGRRVVAVPPAYTSQDCRGCGARVPKSLGVRTHVCPSAGWCWTATRTRHATLWAGQALQALTQAVGPYVA